MILILVILLILIFGTGPWYSYSTGWGYYPSGVFTVILVVLLLWILLGGRRF